MDPSLQFWLVASVVITALAFVFQIAILSAMFLGIRRTQQKIEKLLDNEVQPLLAQVRELTVEGRKAVDALNGAAAHVNSFAMTQAERLDGILAEAADRAMVQVVRVDGLVTDTLNRMETTTAYVQKNILKPLGEIQALLIGFRTALDFLVGRRRPSGPVERSPQDEEMFI